MILLNQAMRLHLKHRIIYLYLCTQSNLHHFSLSCYFKYGALLLHLQGLLFLYALILLLYHLLFLYLELNQF